MTSVKAFEVETEPTATTLGRGAFVFSDDYSVFDWGRMPDEIPEKGQTLCLMGASNFEVLDDAGIPTHYRGVTVDGLTGRTTDVDDAPRRMEIELTQVPELPFRDGTYDYEAYHDVAGENYLVPLEIVFRNRVPIGSSLRTRTEPADHGLAFTEWPDHDVELAAPIVECSTKFEESDRYLDADEADSVAGHASLAELCTLAHDVNGLITERADEAGLDHLDGKIEVLYHRGELKVADVVGTFDENRFAFDGTQVSKEVIRQYYAEADPDWVNAIAAAKREARERDVADWRELCSPSPSPLPEEVIDLASDLYRAGANAYLDERWFDAPPLRSVVRRVAALER